MSTATELVSKAMENRFQEIHLDTADRRGLSNIGKFDVGNLWLATMHGAKFLLLLATKRPTVVYVPIAQAWLPFLRDCVFLIPAKLTRRRVVVHLHGGYFGTFYRNTTAVMRWIVRFALGGATCAIVLGRKVEDAFEDIVPPSRVRIIPNGIPDLFKDSATQHQSSGGRTLLFLSTLMAEKGVLDLLRALPQVAERVGSIRTIFAGQWYSQNDREAAAHLLQAFGAEITTEFTGPIGPDRKRELLQDCDIFVFPTAYPFEGHPYVLLEAMAAGLPIISTKWACIPEMVEDGVNGFLIEAGDTHALVEKLFVLLTDDLLRRKMGQASRQRYLMQFHFDIFARRLCALFAEALDSVQAKHMTETP